MVCDVFSTDGADSEHGFGAWIRSMDWDCGTMAAGLVNDAGERGPRALKIAEDRAGTVPGLSC